MRAIVPIVALLISTFQLTNSQTCSSSPTTPSNSVVVTSSGTSMTYNCSAGYALSVENATNVITITCQNGKWSDPNNSCAPMSCPIEEKNFTNRYIVTSSTIGNISNLTEIFSVAVLSNETFVPFNSTIVYACIENYTFAQSVLLASATCKLGPSIDVIENECTPIPCVANFTQLVNYSDQFLSMSNESDSSIQVGPYFEFSDYNTFPVYSAVEFNCEDDTVPSSVNNSVIGICNLGGQWTLDNNLTCAPILCKENPPNVNFTINNLANFTQRRINGTFTYTCAPFAKFQNVNITSVTCQQINATYGQWSMTQGDVKCNLAICATQNLSNAFVPTNNKSYYHGYTATATCNENMVLYNSTLNTYSINCFNGTWLPDANRCFENECPPPAPPPFTDVDGVVIIVNSTAMEANLYPNYSTFPVNSTVHYTCKPGFVNDSDNSTYTFSTCNSGQVWLPSNLVCRPPPCTNISIINNTASNVAMLTPKGWSTVVQSFNLSTLDVNSTLIYNCTYGYAFTPSNGSNLTCLYTPESGSILSNSPSCGMIPCSNFPIVNYAQQKQVTRLSNGSIVVDNSSPNLNSYAVNSLIEYTCNSMYRPKNNYSKMLTQCMLGPYWSNNVISNYSCEPIPCNIKTIVVPNSQSTLFIALANGTIQSFNGTNSFELPVINAWLTFQCDYGYRLKGNLRNMTCSLGPVLSSSVPVCESIPCPKFNSINNADITFNNNASTEQSEYSNGTIVTFTCKAGYKMNTSLSNMTCLFGGQWSNFSSTCQLASCQWSGPVANATATFLITLSDGTQYSGPMNESVKTLFPSGQPVNSTIQYKCNENYRASNQATVINSTLCELGPKLTASNLICELQPCLKLSNYFFLKNNFNQLLSAGGDLLEYAIGTQLEISCAMGYKLLNSTNVVQSYTCNLGGKWQAQTNETCVALPCTDGLSVNNTSVILIKENNSQIYFESFVNLTQVSIGTSLSYSCVSTHMSSNASINSQMVNCVVGPKLEPTLNFSCIPKPCTLADLNNFNANILNVSILSDDGAYSNFSYNAKETFPLDAVVYLNCKSAYEYPETNSYVRTRCVLTPKWITEVGGKCIPKPCPLPTNLAINNAKMYLASVPPGGAPQICDCPSKSFLNTSEKLIYKCNDGFRPKIGFDKNEAICSLGPSFVMANFICEQSPCFKPPAFPNTIPNINLINKLNLSLLEDEYGEGSWISYQCNNRSRLLLDGVYTITCQPDGFWNITANITCTAFTCNQSFPSIVNATIKNSSTYNISYDIGQIIEYTCIEGTNFVSGSNKFECALDAVNSRAFWTIAPSSSSSMICNGKYVCK